jgi:dTDP-4-amino-4,6-dideoxygalactose transaminase
MKERIWLSPPHMSGSEMSLIAEAFESNWVAPAGPSLTAFENELAKYNNINYCAALSTGTAAIHLALIILGVERGDEILCSTFTFSGSCNPIAYLGAKAVFIDSENLTWNMDPELLEEAILDRIKITGKKPKAIIVVHLYGMPAQIDKIMVIAGKYDIPVIEDAAEALGSKLQERFLGTWGDLGVFSFNGNKIITTSGGGALVSNNDAWIKKARFLSTQARDPAPHYEHSEIGYNYRLSNICACIGLGQLKVLDDRIQKKRKIFSEYQQALQDLNSVQFLPEPGGFYANRWLTTVLLDDKGRSPMIREKIRLDLEESNIESRPLWKPMHLQKVFSDCPAYLTGVSEYLFERGLCLPSGTTLNSDQIHEISRIVRLNL